MFRAILWEFNKRNIFHLVLMRIRRKTSKKTIVIKFHLLILAVTKSSGAVKGYAHCLSRRHKHSCIFNVRKSIPFAYICVTFCLPCKFCILLPIFLSFIFMITAHPITNQIQARINWKTKKIDSQIAYQGKLNWYTESVCCAIFHYFNECNLTYICD